MEEKIFNLMEKMYVDLSAKMDNMYTDLNTKIDNMYTDLNTKMDNMYTGLSTRMDKMESRMDSMESRMATKKDLVRLENKMDDNFKALYDGYKQNAENITEIRKELKVLTDKVDNQEIKLQVLKSAK